MYVNAQTRYAIVWLFTLTDVIANFTLTNDTGADDGVDEVKGRHGDGALLLLTFRVVTHRQLMKVTLRRLGTFWQPLTSHTKCIQ